MEMILSKLSFLTDKLIPKAVASWLFVCTGCLLLRPKQFTDLSFFQDANIIVFGGFIAVVYVILSIFDHAKGEKSIAERSMIFSLLIFAFMLTISYSGDKQNTFFLTVAIVVLIAYIYKREKNISLLKEEWSEKSSLIIIIIVAAIFALITMRIVVYRYLTFSSPNFDFGIFVQMFHNMKTTGLPNTTCERDMLLSHFAVHVSPAFYLILPFYMIFPSPITLQVAQVVIIYSGIIPFCLIAKKYNLGNKTIAILALMYAAYPALSSGCFYDLHENCFLVPFLLWMFYFYEKEKFIPMYVFAGLTCMVKEDAFIYVAIFAVYILISKAEKHKSYFLFFGAGAYFVAVSYLMTKYGQGIMASRFSNLIYENSGLMGVVKTALLNPGYIFTQIFTTKDGGTDKLIYCMQLLLPLAFLPFMSKKISRCILIAPMLINLITTYGYQYKISFQYSFGISAFLFYIAVINISEIKPENRKHIASFAAVMSCLLFAMTSVPGSIHYSTTYSVNKEQYKAMNAILEQIPDDASVTCSTFLLPHIANRSVLYEVEYHSEPSTEILVLDIRGGYNEIAEKYREIYEAAGYVPVVDKENMIAVYRSADYDASFTIE